MLLTLACLMSLLPVSSLQHCKIRDGIQALSIAGMVSPSVTLPGDQEPGGNCEIFRHREREMAEEHNLTSGRIKGIHINI